MKSSIIFVALFSVAFAADFKLIGQDEILEFIQSRWDLDNFEGQVSDETLGNSVREILVTDLNIVDTGDVEFEDLDGSAKLRGLKVLSNSDLTTTTTVTGANKTESCSTDRKCNANLQVAVTRGHLSDTVFVKGSATGSVTAKTTNGSLSLTRNAAINSEITTVRIGGRSNLKVHPIHREFHELIDMFAETLNRGVFFSAIKFQSERNVTTTVGKEVVKSLERSSGQVLVTRVPQGISVSSRTTRFMAVEDSKKPPVSQTSFITTLIA